MPCSPLPRQVPPAMLTRMPLARRTRVALAALCLVASCGGDPVSPNAPVDVFTPGNTFSPFSASIPVGGVVRFNIFGDKHDVTFSRAVAGYPADIIVVQDT